jgi:hypothetical protein
MSRGRKVRVECPKCKSKMNYTKTNYCHTKNGLIKCRVKECDYVFTKDESDRIDDYLMIEWMKKTPKGESKNVNFR